MESCRSLNKKHYIGLFCCFVGIVLVGASSLIGAGNVETNAQEIALGMALIIIAQVSSSPLLDGLCRYTNVHKALLDQAFPSKVQTIQSCATILQQTLQLSAVQRCLNTTRVVMSSSYLDRILQHITSAYIHL